MSQILSGIDINTSYNPQPRALVKTDQGTYLIAGRAFNGSNPDTGFAILYNPGAFNPIVWDQSYAGDYSTMFFDAAQLRDGNFIAVGISFTSIYAGDEDIWLVKIDANDGSIIWQKTLGSAGVKRDGYAVTASSDGGFAISALYLVQGQESLKSQIIKFDSDGTQQWETDLDDGVGYSIIQTSDGGYAVCGSTPATGTGNTNMFAAKLDSGGGITWQTVYTDLTIYVMLQSDIIENADGTFTMCGKNVLMKVDASGNVLWAHQNYSLDMNSVMITDSGYAVAGGLIDVNGATRAYIAGVDDTGKKLNWDNTEILYNSTIAGIALTAGGQIMGVGSAPYGASTSELFVCTFTNVSTLFPAGAEAGSNKKAAMTA